jgi:hypothetical protein
MSKILFLYRCCGLERRMAMSKKRLPTTLAHFRGRSRCWIIILAFVGTLNLWSRYTTTSRVLLLVGESSRLQIFSGAINQSAGAPVVNAAAVVPVFYNLFIGPDTNYTRARDLVNDQLSLMLPEHEANIMAIGVAPNSSSFFEKKVKVRLIAHHDQGDEKLSLYELWKFCQNNTDSKVVYMHSKGTFHPTKQNDALRQYLSTGALSYECLHLPDVCNVCGTRISPLPHPHIPGNMWLARCSYVQHLINPLIFSERMNQVQQARDSSCHGTSRYAQEHWILSHPANRPCDLDSSSAYIWDYTRIPSTYETNLAMAPRYPLARYSRQVCKGIGYTQMERVTEYASLYGPQLPPPTWWGWSILQEPATNVSVARR